MRLLGFLAALVTAVACAPQVVDVVGVPAEAGVIVQTPPSLLHRYRFDGTGSVAVDSRGAAHGTIVGAALADTGSLTLAGAMSGQHVDLPDGIISGLVDATFEAWVVWDGGIYWQRIFDFGNTAPNGSGTRYLFLTPSDPSGVCRLVHSTGGVVGETPLSAPVPMPAGVPAHVAAVIDDQNDRMSLYLDGVLQDSIPFADRLADVDDVNNWLGRSNYPADNGFAGTFYEFRIYDSALSEADVVQSYEAGPDAKLADEP